jgi:PAS domain S-box-containing protein
MVKLIKKSSNNNAIPVWLMAVLAVIAAVIAACGYWFYNTQAHQLRQKIIVELETIARLKSDQIVQWREQRLADAWENMASPFFNQGVNAWLTQATPESRQALLERFKGMTLFHHYSNILLVDTMGRVKLSLYDAADRIPEEDIKLLAGAFKAKMPVLTDLHLCQQDGSVIIDVIAPLYSINGNPSQPIGALVLQIDPGLFLYPLIQTWPVPSRTAETLLVQREGDHVVFLNKLRHLQKEPFEFRIPVSRESVPAVRAVLGMKGVFIGTDYRGEKVLSVLTAIPDSSWFMVTKMDAQEAFDHIKFNKWLIVSLVMGLMVIAFVGTGLLWQYMRKLHYKAIYHAEMQRQALLSHFGHLVKYANDIILLADEKLKIVEANDRAIEIYGYTREELLSLNIEDLIASEDMDNFRQRIRHIKEKGAALAEAVHRRKDGVKLPVEVSARVIEVRGKPFIQSIVRDIRERKRSEEALRSEKQKFQFLTEKSPFGMVVVDKKGAFKYINPRFTEIFGYDLKDVPDGKTWFKRAYPDPDYRRHVIASWMDELAKSQPGEKRPKTYVVHCKDGAEKFVHFIPIQLETGDNLMFCDDISEQMEAEKKLKESEERYRALFDRSLDCIYLHDFKGKFIDLNDAALNLLGYEKKDIAFLSLSSLISRDQFIKTEQILDELFKVGYQQNITEFRVKRKDGQEIFLEVKTSLVFHDGKPYAVQGVGRDITRRKQIEDELRKLAMVIQYSSELVNLANLQGQMVFLNEAGSRILGIKPEEAERHHILEVVPEAYHDAIKKEILPGLLSGGTWEGELQYKNLKTGGLIDAHAMTFPIKDPASGEIICLANVSLDITERKRAEKERANLEEQLMQSQKLESIGRLAGGVAHDFNNMLAIIIGYADIVIKDLHDSNPMREKTKEILKAAERARDLTRQLLAFARKQTLDMTHLELNQIVSGFEKMLRRTLRENVAIKLRLSRDSCVFQGDMGQIEQIILNIAVNAQDAMPDGGTLVIETTTVSLEEGYIKSHEGIAPGKYIMLGMSDTGSGMSRETQEKIFEPFYTTKEVGKGTGLGLSTVYGIVKQHGGHIHVYSEPGKGTSFKIYFPQKEKTADSVREGDLDIMAEMGKETVLVVEDNDQVRNLSCEILKLHGYKVIDTPDGKNAMEVVKSYSGPIHLLITDVIMPDMNGKELNVNMARIHPGIRTLFMSGYPEDIISHHGVLDPGVNFIQKPFSLHDFVAKVRQVLDAKPSQS